jgi:hypothetical protein
VSRATPPVVSLCAYVWVSLSIICVRVAADMGLTDGGESGVCRGTLQTQFEGVSCVLDPAVDIDAVGALVCPTSCAAAVQPPTNHRLC